GPADVRARIGHVGAERPGPDRALQVARQVRTALAEAVEDHLDGAGHVLARALRGGRRSPIAAAESHRAGDLAGEESHLLLETRHLLRHPPSACPLELVVELAQALAVHGLRLGVEELSRITQVAGVYPEVVGDAAGRAGCVRAALDGHLEGVTFASGVAQQEGEVAHALGVAEMTFRPAVADRPVLALAPEERLGSERAVLRCRLPCGRTRRDETQCADT